jgi:hypothetical protein
MTEMITVDSAVPPSMRPFASAMLYGLCSVMHRCPQPLRRTTRDANLPGGILEP